MSEPKHTPGPWEFLPSTNSEAGAIVGKTGFVCDFVDDPSTANARLIAAAPDLLAFARFVLQGFAYGGISAKPMLDFSNPDADEIPMTTLDAMARAVIAKAEGRAE